MKKEFIKIAENRIKTSTIKRYKPIGNKKISIHFSASRTSPQIESIELGSQADRDSLIEDLDVIFGV